MTQQGSLRNRKQGHQSGSSGPALLQEDEDTTAVGPGGGEEDKKQKQQHQDDEQEHHHGAAAEDSAFRLTPLVERSMALRLDVGPFLLLYLALAVLDSTSQHGPAVPVGGQHQQRVIILYCVGRVRDDAGLCGHSALPLERGSLDTVERAGESHCGLLLHFRDDEE